MLRKLALAALLTLAVLGAAAGTSLAGHNQVAMLDDPSLLGDPVAAFAAAKQLGVQQERIFMAWRRIAPNGTSARRPRNLDESDPAAYPAANWTPWDRAISDARAAGVGVNLGIGVAPRWALGSHMPKGLHLSWEPNPRDFAAFMHAVGLRYSGDYDPVTGQIDPGNPDDLPAVRFWSIWNEPNYGPSLAPQGVPGDESVDRAPMLYRQLVDGAWRSLEATGHSHDAVLIGELFPRGYAASPRTRWGAFSGITPVTFVRSLYCLDAHYRPLRGAPARLRGCPAGGRGFRAAHPGLFFAAGFSVHPYSRWYPPNVEAANNPEYASLADIGQLTACLDRAQRAYGSHLRLPVWNTEYGYLTDPPKHSSAKIPYISPATAAVYLNQAEYMSWRNPRVMSFMQYLLYDGVKPTRANNYGGFASGLVDWTGRPKATYFAWRLPLYLPVTSARRGRSLEVWGGARPAAYALRDVPADAESVAVQFRPARRPSFATVATVPIRDPHGYFDTHVRFPGSGTVRLSWTYPADDPTLPEGRLTFSRSVAITLH